MLNLAEGEWKKFLGVMVLMSMIATYRKKEMQNRWLNHPRDNEKGAKEMEEEKPKATLRLVDNPVVPYLIENFSLIGMTWMIENLVPKPTGEVRAREWFKILLRGMIPADLPLFIEKFLCTVVYKHVPYFSERKPNQDFAALVVEYLRCNFFTHIVNTFLQFAVVVNLPADLAEDLKTGGKKTTLGRFLLKFMIIRIVVDLTFGVVHKVMHENKTVYKYIHSTHHEHQTPRTWTNLHFHWIDIFMEAVFPIYIGMTCLTVIGMPPSRTELYYFTSAMIWYESCSHSGKEMPCVTWVPLLSPLMDWITGCDQRLVEYHTRHHQLFNCNYSISPWPDKFLWDTYRIELPESMKI